MQIIYAQILNILSVLNISAVNGMPLASSSVGHELKLTIKIMAIVEMQV